MTETPSPCAFGRAVLAGEAGCALARRRSLGEIEEIACASPVAHLNCTHLLALLRERGAFALHLPPPTRALAHAQSMRLQCGGALAIARALGRARPDDLHDLLAQARERWEALIDLPFAAIVPDMASWQPRRRSCHRPDRR